MTNVTGRKYGTHAPGASGRTLCKRYNEADVNVAGEAFNVSCALCERLLPHPIDSSDRLYRCDCGAETWSRSGYAEVRCSGCRAPRRAALVPTAPADPIAFARGVLTAATPGAWVSRGLRVVLWDDEWDEAIGVDLARTQTYSPDQGIDDARAIALAVNTHAALLDVLAFAAKRGSAFGECCYCDSTEEAHEDDCPIGRALAAIAAEMER